MALLVICLGVIVIWPSSGWIVVGALYLGLLLNWLTLVIYDLKSPDVQPAKSKLSLRLERNE